VSFPKQRVSCRHEFLRTEVGGQIEERLRPRSQSQAGIHHDVVRMESATVDDELRALRQDRAGRQSDVRTKRWGHGRPEQGRRCDVAVGGVVRQNGRQELKPLPFVDRVLELSEEAMRQADIAVPSQPGSREARGSSGRRGERRRKRHVSDGEAATPMRAGGHLICGWRTALWTRSLALIIVIWLVDTPAGAAR
jgi:hypothetical protein